MNMQRIGLIVADSVETAAELHSTDPLFAGSALYTKADLLHALGSGNHSKELYTWWRGLDAPVTVILEVDADTKARLSRITPNARTILTRAVWGARLPNNLLFAATDIAIATQTETVRINWSQL